MDVAAPPAPAPVVPSKEPVIYRCARCGYETNIKCCLQQHFNRKKLCPAKYDNVDIQVLRTAICSPHRDPDKYPIECKTCGKRFTSIQGRCHHKKICKGPPVVNPTLINLQEQVNELRQEIQNQSLETTTIYNLYNQNATLKLKVKDLELAVRLAKEDKREETYQQLLQKYKFHGHTHMKVCCGVTDITTDTVHAEIKRYTHWKDAIGQIMAYNMDHPRSELHIYLFGHYTDDKKQHAASIIHRMNIKPFEVKVIDSQFIITDLVQGAEEHFDITV